MAARTITHGRNAGRAASAIAAQYDGTIRKPYSGLSGYKAGLINPLTGDYLTLYDARESDMCDNGGRWVVMCEAHSTMVNHRALKSAYATLKSGACEFCDECRALEDATHV